MTIPRQPMPSDSEASSLADLISDARRISFAGAAIDLRERVHAPTRIDLRDVMDRQAARLVKIPTAALNQLESWFD